MSLRCLALIALLAAGCGDSSGGTAATAGKAPGSGTEGASAPPAARNANPTRPLPNILVYLVDTLRADHLGVYGYERDTSPGIDALAAGATTFETAIGQGPWTLPAVASLFTSAYPTSHLVVSNSDRVGEQATTMAEFFHGLGYRTLGFVANTLGGKGAGLDQGYDQFHENPAIKNLTPEQIAAGALSMGALYEWARGYDGSQPYFCWVHTIEPHDPYEGTAGTHAPWFTGTPQEKERLHTLITRHRGLQSKLYQKQLAPGEAEELAALEAEMPQHVQALRDLYDGDVRRASDNFARLIDTLKQRPRWDDTVVVFLADHGEEFLDHGTWSHGQSVFQELVRVPLIVRLPGIGTAGRRITQPVEIIDVLPTLAEYLGVPALPEWQGRSLLALLQGGPEDAAAPAYTMRLNLDYMRDGPRGDHETALVEDGWKLIVHHDRERASLFDLRADPHEQHDLSAQEPVRLNKLLRQAMTRLESLPALPIRRTEPGTPAFDEEKRQHLLEMGYIEGERNGR